MGTAAALRTRSAELRDLLQFLKTTMFDTLKPKALSKLAFEIKRLRASRFRGFFVNIFYPLPKCCLPCFVLCQNQTKHKMECSAGSDLWDVPDT